MFLTRNDINVARRGLGQVEQPETTVGPKGIVVSKSGPHWVVQTIVGSIISAAIFITAWKKFM